MFHNYLITAIRNIYNNKLSSAINIGGLAVGIAACLLIWMFVQDELSFDNWLNDVERINKVEVTFLLPGKDPIELALSPMPIGPALQTEYPQIEEVVRIAADSVTVRRGKETFDEDVYFVEENFFNVFDLPMVKGDRERALRGNTQILLSESMAYKYFGGSDPIGEVITVNRSVDYEVVGVMEDTPVNSHFKASFIALLDTGRPHFSGFLDNWGRIRVHTYVKLKSGASASDIENDLDNFVSRKVPIQQRTDDGFDLRLNFIAVSDIHLHGTKPGHLKANGNMATVIAFSIVAIFILIIAGINFMNLATARAMSRAREVSVRKVHGAKRKDLIIQFLGEAMITTLISLLLAIIICVLVLPMYNEFLNKQLSITSFIEPQQLVLVFGLVLAIGFLGGMYPAFVLSSFRPAKVLRSNKSSQHGSAWFRNALVVLQFSISIVLSLTTSIVYIQTQFARNIDFGFDVENKLTLFDIGSQDVGTLKQELGKLSGVSNIAFSKRGLPFSSDGSYESVEVLGGAERAEFSTEIVDVGVGFFDIYQIEPLAGRVFSEEFRGDLYSASPDGGVDKASIVVNQAFVDSSGITESQDMVDRTLMFRGWGVEGIVVGVIDDVYMRSLYQKIEPMAFVLKEDKDMSVMTLHISADDHQRVLDQIDERWSAILPDKPIARAFVADRFDALYQPEDKRARLFSVFAFFAIFVSCLGLYGLASYTIGRYTKEIGIRKVLGASVTQIVKLLVWQFTKPVFLACIISIPIATWLAMDWLSGFEYRISLAGHSYVFVLVVLAVFVISWSTVIGQSVKVAKNKLINALQGT